jgi:hypothetical protein
MSFLKKLEPDKEGMVKVGFLGVAKILFNREYKLDQKLRFLLLCASRKFNVINIFVDRRGNIRWRKVSVSLIRLGLSYFTSMPGIFKRVLSTILYVLLSNPRGKVAHRNITAFIPNRTVSAADRMSAIDVQAYVSEPVQDALQKATIGLIWSPTAIDFFLDPALVENEKMTEIFYGGQDAVKESLLSNQDYERRLEKKTKEETSMKRTYSDVLGERVLMEWSLKLVYAENLESGKMRPIEGIDEMSMEDIAEKMGPELTFVARYTAMPIVAKLELEFSIISLAYSKKLSVLEITGIIKKMHGKL